MKRMIPVVCSLLFTAGTLTSPAQYSAFTLPASDESPSFLGVYLMDVSEESADDLGLKREQGAICAEVVSDTPAEAAGLEPDDVINRWDGVRVRSARHLKRLVSDTPVDRTVKVGIIRDGEAKQLKVTVGARESDAPPARRGIPLYRMGPQGGMELGPWHPPIGEPDLYEDLFARNRPRLGVAMQPLTEQLAGYFGLEEGQEGVLIVEIIEDSAADEAGLRAGDVITKLQGKTVGSPEEVQELVRSSEGTVKISVIRDGEKIQVRAKLDDDEPDEDDDALKEEISYPRGAM